MKNLILLAILALFITAIWYIAPIELENRNCYNNAVSSSDDIAFRSRAAGWAEQRICEEKFNVVSALGECLTQVNSKRPPKIMSIIAPYTKQIFHLVYPLTKDYTDQKAEFNNECMKYPDLIIP